MNYMNKFKLIQKIKCIVNLLIEIIINAKKIIIVLFFILNLIFKNHLITSELIIAGLIYIWIHEIGHMIFMYIYDIQFTYKSSMMVTKIIADEKKISLLNRKEQIFIAAGGIIFSLLYAIICIISYSKKDHLVILGIIIIINEFNNLLFGKDGKIIQEIVLD